MIYFLAATLFCILSSLARTAAYISHSESEMKSADCEKSLLTHSSIVPKEPLTINVYVVFRTRSSKSGNFCRHSFVMSCLFISQHLSKNCLLPYLPNSVAKRTLGLHGLYYFVYPGEVAFCVVAVSHGIAEALVDNAFYLIQKVVNIGIVGIERPSVDVGCLAEFRYRNFVYGLLLEQ